MSPRRTRTGRAHRERDHTNDHPSDHTVVLSRAWLRRHPLPQPDPDGDKDSRGTVLVVGGAITLPGAVLLAGIGALRAGAGKLQLATCRDVVPQVATAVPEALVAQLPQTDQGGISATAGDEIVRRAEGVDVLLLGPGMVDQPNVNAIVRQALAEIHTPVIVLDAAAIEPVMEFAALARTHGGRVILTPHAGEMASMLGVERDAVSADPRAHALRAASLLDVVVVLKGPSTFVASPDGTVACYSEGGVGLGTSGSGDTLAGVIAGLAARGAEPMLAACWGVWLHGGAGNALARRIGPIGYLARELLDEIPGTMRRVAAK